MNVISTVAVRAGRFTAAAAPHAGKTLVCCGLPVAASHVGMRLWELPPSAEYGLAVLVAAGVTAVESAWPGRPKPTRRKVAVHFARNALIAVGVTFAVHAAGLHPHHPENDNHTGDHAVTHSHQHNHP